MSDRDALDRKLAECLATALVKAWRRHMAAVVDDGTTTSSGATTDAPRAVSDRARDELTRRPHRHAS